MRWASWALGIAGVLQHAAIAILRPDDYISLDTSYLVMWLALIGALLLCYLSCWGDCYGDGCDCCDDGCTCGDGDCCAPDKASHGHEGPGHEGHTH
ncbi:MAG: hypothetical protein AABY18_06160 [Candidatus Thermoplasmatota archaeon]